MPVSRPPEVTFAITSASTLDALHSTDRMMVDDPFDHLIAALRAHGSEVHHHPAGRARARCPSHSDQRASLSITRVDDKVLMRCFAGCKNQMIVVALGLRMADLFSGPRKARVPSKIVTTYEYESRDGVRLQKVRYGEPKGFSWRRADSAARGGWRSGLDGLVPILYRLPELAGARVVYVVEGEKAADALWNIGLPATCGSAGVSCWKWSRDVLSSGCRELVVLADHDQAGERHAERVSADIHTLDEAIAVKLVKLPGLAPGGDVVDFLEAGHDLDGLLAVVAQTPVWFPGAKEHRRKEIRRDQARERMRKHRAKNRAVVVPAPTKTAARSDTEALAAVLALLAEIGECSGRGIVKTLTTGKPVTIGKRALERALVLGVSDGVIMVEGGEYRRGCTKLYRCAPDIRSVTKSAHSPNLHIVTEPRHSPSVPPNHAGAEPVSDVVTKETSVVQCPVTMFAVTHGERSSFTLQEKKDRPGHTRVTGGGTVSLIGDQSKCCGKYGAGSAGGAILPWCKLCAQSPIYVCQGRAGEVTP